ncbi:hypothetical protein SAMN06893096_104286 [Geodermatophilus pulveris]|uniref:Uncharacterized protein n=1 Tax=Geodermatophilus pulveris TaxID=1564159 RepID=A0A239ESQ8_9ACTN|nr:hypothetical protein [Geodermatophilus pulveris]SNS47716.1 hypothetical protein SAMN06893096_104286 [Geodermatophilus pulveris]
MPIGCPTTSAADHPAQGDGLVQRPAGTAADRHATATHAAAAAFGDALRPFLPVDAEGDLVDRVVASARSTPR